MAFLAAVLAALSVLSLIIWVGTGHRQAVRQRLSLLDPTRPVQPRGEAARGRPSAFRPAITALGQRLLRLLPVGWVSTLRARLVAAGRPVTPAGYMVLTLVFAAILGGAVFVLAAPAVGVASPRLLILTAIFAAIGAYLPHFWLSRTIRSRKEVILSELPDGLDLMTTCVEAGLGLDGAMAQMATQLGGPLGEEIQLTLSDMALGRRRAEALTAMADRVDLPELTAFVQALVQADQLGVSIGQVLRVQSDVMRTKHRQYVEQKVYQAPVKMLFPLVFLIFPAMFIVILGSAIIEMRDGLFG